MASKFNFFHGIYYYTIMPYLLEVFISLKTKSAQCSFSAKKNIYNREAHEDQEEKVMIIKQIF